MNITSIPRFLFAGLIFVASLYSGLPVWGQIAEFEEGNYRQALGVFQELIENQPDNVMNYYYAGRCLVELNEDMDDAIEYLYSASRRGAPADASYYLGRAYHLDYNFSEAKKYYGRFELEASRQELKDLRVKYMINTCRSALQITASYNQYEVATVTFLDLRDSLSYSQIRMKGGQLQRKPAEYFKVGEDRTDLNSLMFMPSRPIRGDYAFFSGPGKPGKEGLQLYRVKKGSGKSWGDPQELKDLNTEGDELLPYYDPIENDLYFASNGGAGVGGFDLYRAHYDPDRDEWTEPINLGFPINSVRDEYLLLPGSDLGMMMFFSNRQGTDSTLTVYRVHLVEPKLKTDANDTEMLKKVASLGDVANEILAEISAISEEKLAEDAVPAEAVTEAVTEARAETFAEAPETVYTPVKVVSREDPAPTASSQGREYLAEALRHQAASDSLKDLATGARAYVRDSDDPNDRWVWQKQIMVWEKRAQDEEQKADVLYAMMEENRNNPVSSTAPAVNAPEADNAPEALSVAGISASPVEGEPGTQPRMKELPREDGAVYINRFDILGSSPYTKANPIPVDLALPEGVFYRIQLGAFGKAVEPGTFKGISPITAETIKERGLIKYYAGKFSKYEDASTALSKIRSRGYEDAFISAWYDRVPVSTQKAMKLE